MVSSFLGYDPIEKQFKLLSMTQSSFDSLSASAEHQILTLGRGKLSWRKIECSIPHYPLSDSICINGVLYYLAGGLEEDRLDDGIVCFDIKSEKFKFIKAANNVWQAKLVNYMGKLATLKSDDQVGKRISGEKSTSFELAVLVDAEKHEWSNHTYVFPPLWKDIVADSDLSCVGVTRTGEIVLSPYGFYLIYYNLERDTITKVEIQGFDTSEYFKVHTFLDHVEDVKLWSSV